MIEEVKHRILMVDDERVAMRSYQQELELAGFEVWHYNSTAKIKSLLESKKPERIDLFIIDIMMPPGQLYSDEKTDVGLLTGLFVAQDIRSKYTGIPIILFSNATFESVLRAARRLSSQFENCIFLRKEEILPYELSEIVTKYFKEMKLDSNRRHRILKKLFGSLLLQPNISGIGIDLKKLGKGD